MQLILQLKLKCAFLFPTANICDCEGSDYGMDKVTTKCHSSLTWAAVIDQVTPIFPDPTTYLPSYFCFTSTNIKIGLHFPEYTKDAAQQHSELQRKENQLENKYFLWYVFEFKTEQMKFVKANHKEDMANKMREGIVMSLR